MSKKEPTPVMTATGTLMSIGRTTIKDTTLPKFKFRISGTSDSKEFARELEKTFGVEDVDRPFPQGSLKADLRDYGVYLEITFGTQIEEITTFQARAVAATFVHTVKNAGDGVEDTVVCNVDCIKNKDTADDLLDEYIKFKELNPQSGKKVLVPMKFELKKLDSDPIVLRPIDGTGDED